MKKLFAILLILSAIGLTYFFCFRYEEVVVKDISMPQTIILTSKDKHVLGLDAHIEGYLDDTAFIQGIKIGKGKVNSNLYNGDFYADSLSLLYLPNKAKTGKLRIKYRFNTY